ncbi:hypothetical protein C9I50_23040 [Pseudomonas prosekii]|nr:hypothetical protein BI292_25505 [Pseudomonas sp. 43NM1]PWE38279.1 hypothetical protein C9I50_23040 [Pseudomonas prosekii]
MGTGPCAAFLLLSFGIWECGCPRLIGSGAASFRYARTEKKHRRKKLAKIEYRRWYKSADRAEYDNCQVAYTKIKNFI